MPAEDDSFLILELEALKSPDAQVKLDIFSSPIKPFIISSTTYTELQRLCLGFVDTNCMYTYEILHKWIEQHTDLSFHICDRV